MPQWDNRRALSLAAAALAAGPATSYGTFIRRSPHNHRPLPCVSQLKLTRVRSRFKEEPWASADRPSQSPQPPR
jgi:hypothetical protein